MFVCVCVMEVGCSWGRTRLVTCDLCTEPRTLRRMFENIGHGLESSRTAGGCNWGAAVKADVHVAAVEADAIGEQKLKRTRLGSSSSAQRAVWRWITHVGERGGSSEASEAACM